MRLAGFFFVLASGTPTFSQTIDQEAPKCVIPTNIAVEAQNAVELKLGSFYPTDSVWNDETGTIQLWAHATSHASENYDGEFLEEVELISHLAKILLWQDIAENTMPNRKGTSSAIVGIFQHHLSSTFPSFPKMRKKGDVIIALKCTVICMEIIPNNQKGLTDSLSKCVGSYIN